MIEQTVRTPWTTTRSRDFNFSIATPAFCADLAPTFSWLSLTLWAAANSDGIHLGSELSGSDSVSLSSTMSEGKRKTRESARVTVNLSVTSKLLRRNCCTSDSGLGQTSQKNGTDVTMDTHGGQFYRPEMCLRNAVTSVLHSNGSALCENTDSKAVSDSSVCKILVGLG
jgi:hypothetical protein